MSSATQTVQIPSANLHVDAQDVESRGAPSDLGTLDRLDSPGAESSVSQFTRPPPSVQQYHNSQLNTTASYDFARPRSNSNLSPPQHQTEWTQGRTSQDAQGRTSITRPRSNSNRYYAEARERSGTVNSTTQDQDHQRMASQSPPIGAASPPQQQARTLYDQQPPVHPQGPAPAYKSPPQQHYEHFAPQSAPSHVQPDVNPLTQPSAEPAMVTPLEHLNEKPALVDCPRCQTQTYTTVTKEAGDAVTLWAVVLCCLTGVLCAWVPCVIDDCKDTVHRCSQCTLLLATVTSNGAVRIAQGVSKPVASQYQQRAQMQAPQGEKPGEQPWPQQQQQQQQREMETAPTGWRDNGETRQEGVEHQQHQQHMSWQQPNQQAFSVRQEAASVPLVEMEDTSEPVELPGNVGAGWLGKSTGNGPSEKKAEKAEHVKREEKQTETEKRE